MLWCLFTVPVLLVFGFLAALLLSSSWRFRMPLRALFLVPRVTPGVVAAIAWRWMYLEDLKLYHTPSSDMGNRMSWAITIGTTGDRLAS